MLLTPFYLAITAPYIPQAALHIIQHDDDSSIVAPAIVTRISTGQRGALVSRAAYRSVSLSAYVIVDAFLLTAHITGILPRTSVYVVARCAQARRLGQWWTRCVEIERHELYPCIEGRGL